MALDKQGLLEAEKRRRIVKGVGSISKQVRGKALKPARRRSTVRRLADDEVGSLLRAGMRVHDKTRGIYVHI